ncbi:MAG: hypothetical protein ABI876_00595 [Bacteroidota bacterium]
MMDAQAIERIVMSTLHLFIDESDPPEFGSGCFVQYRDIDFLFTVAHNTEPSSFDEACDGRNVPVYINLEQELDGQIATWGPCWMSFIYGVDVVEDIDNQLIHETQVAIRQDGVRGLWDICYRILKSIPEVLQLPVSDLGIPLSVKKTIVTSLEDEFDADQEYGCFGRIRPSFDSTVNRWSLESRFHGGIKFSEEIGEMVEFTLPEKIDDIQEFQGISGAPILDSNGRLVALVSMAEEHTNKLYGFSAKALKRFLDLEVNQQA